MDVEGSAVGCMLSYLSNIDTIVPLINNKDKEPFYDGKIMIYLDKEHKKYHGYINVQVKGKEGTVDIPDDNIRYQIKIKDLKAYLLDGGCIYFVVLVNEMGQRIPYYIDLTPIAIKNIFLKAKGKKKVTIELKKVPDIFVFKNIIYSIITNCKIQSRTNEIKQITIQMAKDYENKGYRIMSDVILNPSETNNDFIFKYSHSFYLTNKKDILLIDGDNRIESISCSVGINIKIKDKIYYTKYDKKEYRDYFEIKIGKALTMNLSKNDNKLENNNSVVAFNDKHYCIDEYITDLEFIIAALKNKSFTIETKNNKTLICPFEINDDKNFDIMILEERLKKCINFKAVLDILGLNSDIKFEISNLTSSANYYIDMLIDGILYGNIIEDKKIGIFNPFVEFAIGNVHLLVYMEKVDGGIKLYNADCKRLDVEMCYNDSLLNHSVSQYHCLTAKNLSILSNLNFDNIYDTYVEIGNINDINEFALRLIEAYDISSRIIYIDTANRLLEWAIKNNNDVDFDDILHLNVIQIRKRMQNVLTYEDQDYLKSLLYNEKNNTEVKFGAALLLDDIRNADLQLKNMSDNNKKKLSELPIYKKYYLR